MRFKQEDKKVSGTAAKLSRNAAYHHCTVLVDVNECRLHDAISSKAEGVESRATQVLALAALWLVKIFNLWES